MTIISGETGWRPDTQRERAFEENPLRIFVSEIGTAIRTGRALSLKYRAVVGVPEQDRLNGTVTNQEIAEEFIRSCK